MFYGKPMNDGFLTTIGTIIIICCENRSTVQAIGWMHVTPLTRPKYGISSIVFLVLSINRDQLTDDR